ncbi:MAG: MXAN_5187 C-terminal domain-containing protein [Planctomycetota bacterium]
MRRWRAQPPPRNTGVRFKLNSLISKFSSFDRYWERILKEMEDGRFSRDVYNMAKKKRNQEMVATYSPNAAKQQEKRKLRPESGTSQSKSNEQAAPQPADPGEAETETVTARGKPAPRPVKPASETASTARAVPNKRPAARPAPAAAGGEDQQKLQKTYRTFMAARKKTGEPTSNMNYDKVMRQFEKKIPDFKKRHGCRDVEFKVVIKDGKAKIKAVPIK